MRSIKRLEHHLFTLLVHPNIKDARVVLLLQSDYLGDLAVAPVISRGECTESVDERGSPALNVSIHCTIHGIDKVSTSVINPTGHTLPLLPPLLPAVCDLCECPCEPLSSPPSPPSPPLPPPNKPGAKKKTAEPVKPVEGEGSETNNKEKDDVIFAFESFNTYIGELEALHNQ